MAIGNPFIDALVSGVRWTDLAASTPATEITVSFMNDGTAGAWTAVALTAFRNVFASWERVANIDFVEAASGGRMLEYLDHQSALGTGILAYHNFPVGSGSASGHYSVDDYSWTAERLNIGGQAYLTILHEIGHGIGIAHPHDTGMDTAIFPGVVSGYDRGASELNYALYTVMSYNDPVNTVTPGVVGFGPFAFGYPSGPMAFDIAAAQVLYGANMATNAGNTTYYLGRGFQWDCIWDAGGIDEISAVGAFGNITIDLRSATLQNAAGGGGYFSHAPSAGGDGSYPIVAVQGVNPNVNGAFGGMTIAADVLGVLADAPGELGVIIENATGGESRDILIGNNVSNVLRGNAGDDNLIGNGGDDLLVGGSGYNTIDGGGGRDVASYGFSYASLQAGITRTADAAWRVYGLGYSDTLRSVEVAQFTDMTISLRERADTDVVGNGTSGVILQSGNHIIDWVVQNGAYAGYRSIGAANGYRALGSGDFNGDGTHDVLLQDATGAMIDWSLSGGNYFGYAHIGNANAAGYGFVGTGDVNGDGTTDILVENGNGTLVDWVMQGGRYAGYNVIGNTSGYKVVGTGDFNGDAVSDVLLANANGTIVDWLMSNGRFAGHCVIGNANAAGYGVVGTGDFNNDGTTDILLQNAAGTLVTWFMRFGSYAGYSVVGNAGAFGVVATGDYNGDGTTDILLQNAGGTVIDWSIQNGQYTGWNQVGFTAGYAVMA